MADPVISDIQISPTNPAPGQVVTVTIVASDADSRSYPLTITVADQAGGTGTGQITMNVVDGLTYGIESDPPLTWVQDPNDPAKFNATIPA